MNNSRIHLTSPLSDSSSESIDSFSIKRSPSPPTRSSPTLHSNNLEWVKVEPIEMVEIQHGEDDIKSEAVFNPARQIRLKLTEEQKGQVLTAVLVMIIVMITVLALIPVYVSKPAYSKSESLQAFDTTTSRMSKNVESIVIPNRNAVNPNGAGRADQILEPSRPTPQPVQPFAPISTPSNSLPSPTTQTTIRPLDSLQPNPSTN